MSLLLTHYHQVLLTIINQLFVAIYKIDNPFYDT